jgi:hypothetical protein
MGPLDGERILEPSSALGGAGWVFGTRRFDVATNGWHRNGEGRGTVGREPNLGPRPLRMYGNAA